MEFTLLGLAIGSLYAMGAMGIVSIHRGSKTLNFAQGGVASLAAYVFIRLRDGHHLGGPLSAIITVACGALLGVVIYGVAVSPIRNRNALTKMVMTIGILGVLTAIQTIVFGTQVTVVASSLPSTSVDVLGTRIGEDRLIILGIAVLLAAALSIWSNLSRLALSTRAMSEHETAARSLGYSPHLLGALNWALGCALASLAGILFVPILGLGPTVIGLTVVPSIAAALLGKFDSYWLALGGGLVIGVAESQITNYVTTTGWSAAAPFVIIVIALVLRRDKTANRLTSQSAIPVASGKLHPVMGIIALGAALGLLSVASPLWLDAATISMVYAILGLSMVVLIGYANQISLAQIATAGLGAFIAARLAIAWNVPFVILPLVGAVAGGVIGLIVGLPAMKVRGINLAVVTAGMGIFVQEVIFDNSSYTGGINGLQPATPRVFGIAIDAAENPFRYAVFVLFWLLLAIGGVSLLRRSRIGRMLLAMRTNERAAASLGVSVTRAKLSAFVISSAMAGLAGVLLSFRNSPVLFSTYDFNGSLNLVVAAIIAGVGSILGGLVVGVVFSGGILFHWLQSIAFFRNNYNLIFGIGLVLTLLVHPEGITASRRPQPMKVRLPDADADRRPPAQLVAEGVAVHFGGVIAVSDSSISVAPGQVVGLIGPNGAGKTTMLDALNGFASARRGQVTMGGVTLNKKPPHVRARQGMSRVFQGVELFEDLTVAQNLLVGSENAGCDGGKLPAAAREAIDRFGLRHTMDRQPTSLSLADRKLVAVARALAANPSVLLLDEPGAGMSMGESERFADELRYLSREQGLGILVVDHDMSLIMAVCDHIVVMQEGRVISAGSPDEIRSSAAVRDAYLGQDTASTPASPLS